MEMEGEGPLFSESPSKGLAGVSKARIKAELRAARVQLSNHGLMHSAKWAAEQVVGLGEVNEDETQAAAQRLPVSEVAEDEEDVLALARAYFDVREYRRAAHLLTNSTSQRALFLRGYSLYLAGEKRREDTHIESAGSSGASKPGAGGDNGNTELKPLYRQLADAHAMQQLDGFGLYLFGIVLKKLNLQDDARTVLAAAVTAYPWNWGAWLDLASLCHSPQDTTALAVPDHWMKSFFTAHMHLELQSNHEALMEYSALENMFPSSQYIVSQMALARYNMRDFSEAQIGFEKVRLAKQTAPPWCNGAWAHHVVSSGALNPRAVGD
jgi:anaphase-promoting complex subunit 8